MRGRNHSAFIIYAVLGLQWLTFRPVYHKNASLPTQV